MYFKKIREEATLVGKKSLVAVLLLASVSGGLFFAFHKLGLFDRPLSDSEIAGLIGNQFDFEGYKPESTRVLQEKDGVIISSQAGGLYIKTKNTSEVFERVVLQGKNVDGRATLRLRVNDSTPKWLLAPNGIYRYSLAPGSEIELLIYQDSPFKYLVQNVQKEECPSCLSPEQFKSNLLVSLPGLRGAVASSDWEATALILLDYASNKVDLGNTERTSVASGYPPSELVSLFDADAIEGSCGLFATFYQSLLAKFEIESITMDFGIDVNASLTHVTTIVRSPSGQYFFFDPTFNMVFLNEQGRLANAREVIKNQPAVFPRTRPIKRDFRVSSSQGLTFEKIISKTAAFISDKYTVERCARVSIEGQSYLNCPKAPYDADYYFLGWEDRLRPYGIRQGGDIFVSFLKTGEIYSLAGGSEQHRRELSELLRSAGVKFSK